MKLIDILVQELPKRGGFPGNIPALVQDSSGYVYQAGGGPHLFNSTLADDWMCSEITRDQYKAALSSSKPEWDGEGLPPVGSEFLFGTHRTQAKCLGVGQHMIFASKGNFDHDDGDYEEFMIPIYLSEFLPINNEEDRNKTSVIDSLVEFKIRYHSHPKAAEEYLREMTFLYEAIAAGKIPGIRID